MWPCFWMLGKLKCKRIANFFKKICVTYKWNLYIRFWIEAYLEIGMAAFLSVFSVDFENAGWSVNTLAGLLSLAAIVTTPIWFYYIFKSTIQYAKKAAEERTEEDNR